MRNIFILIIILSFLLSCSKEDNSDHSMDDIIYYQMIEDVASRVNTYSYGVKKGSVNKIVDRFTLIHFSDIHCDNNLWKENLEELINFSYNRLVNDRVHALLHTGDMCNGMPARDKNLTISEIKNVNNILLNVKHPVFNVLGNHDSNIEEVSKQNIINSFTEAFTKREQYNYLISPYLLKSKVDMNNQQDKSYYYYDFEKFKIRLIVIDFIDYPIEEDSQKKSFLKYAEGFIFSQEQLDWLCSALKNTPLEYGVIVASHGPLTFNLSVGTYAQGVNLIPDIIDAFKNGDVFMYHWQSKKYRELTTNCVFDFSKRGKGDFICYLSGHIHNRVITTTDKYSNQLIITAPQLYKPASYKENSFFYAIHYSFLDRNSSYLNKNSFNIISIDREENKIYLTCYGAFRDMSGHFMDRTQILNY